MHVAAALAAFHLFLMSRMNDAFFAQLVARVDSQSLAAEERVLAIMDSTHRMQRAGARAFLSSDPDAPSWDTWVSVESSYLWNSSRHLMAPIQACGSFTLALASALDQAEVEFRILQMICRRSLPGCHIMLEAKVDERWVALDPLFNLHFRRPDGKLASFADVQADWDYYQLQIPARLGEPNEELRYDLGLYDYSGVRYTNWDKIPFVMPALKALLAAVLGQEKVETLSIRSYVYDQTRVHLAGVIIAWVIVLALTWLRRRWRQLLSHADKESEPARDGFEQLSGA